MNDKLINTLFLDIGGVLLTNGWDTDERNAAIEHFKLNGKEMEERHNLSFRNYEIGKWTLGEYLNEIVFYEPRSFTPKQFEMFMFKQSVAFQDTIDYFIEVKKQYNLKVIALSNEGRELNAYRIKKFKLGELFDTFIVSSFVHLRKPDPGIFRMAIDIAQAEPQHSLYIDDRLVFVKVAKSLGMHAIHHSTIEETMTQVKLVEFFEHSIVQPDY